MSWLLQDSEALFGLLFTPGTSFYCTDKYGLRPLIRSVLAVS